MCYRFRPPRTHCVPSHGSDDCDKQACCLLLCFHFSAQTKHYPASGDSQKPVFFILITQTFIQVGSSTFGLLPNVAVNIEQFSFQHTTTQHFHLQVAPAQCQPGGTQFFYIATHVLLKKNKLKKRPAGHSTVCTPSFAAGLSDHCCRTHT